MSKKFLWVFLILTVVVLCGLVSEHFYQLMMIQGNSMSPAYRPFQIVLLDKRAKDYRTGDVVAFRCEGLSAVLVKRIAAVPGEKVIIDRGTLLIDGEASPLYDEGVFSFPGLLKNEVSLSSGEYIVIGDNTDESKDSRFAEVGIVKVDSIIGRVLS